jgi:hypothetical protein
MKTIETIKYQKQHVDGMKISKTMFVDGMKISKTCLLME